MLNSLPGGDGHPVSTRISALGRLGAVELPNDPGRQALHQRDEDDAYIMSDKHIIGYTGTRQALTSFQVTMVESLLRYHYAIGYTEFHHGDCVGADEFAAVVAYDLGFRVVSHPPVYEHLRAFAKAHEIQAPLPYLERNTAIVQESQVALAVPNSELPKTGSGTWSTIRKFSQSRIPCWVIGPHRCWVSTPLL